MTSTGPSYRLNGTVLTAGGVAHPATVLTLCDLDGLQVGRSFVDGSGGYTLSAARPGRYLLIVQAPGHHPRAEIVALAAESRAHPVALERLTAQIAGQVRAFPSGIPISGAVVVVTDASGEVRDSTHSGPAGRYALGGLAEGPHTVTGAAEDMWPAAMGLHVPGTGRTVGCDLDMLEPLRPPAGLRVTAEDGALPARWAAAKQDAQSPAEPPMASGLADR